MGLGNRHRIYTEFNEKIEVSLWRFDFHPSYEILVCKRGDIDIKPLIKETVLMNYEYKKKDFKQLLDYVLIKSPEFKTLDNGWEGLLSAVLRKIKER